MTRTEAERMATRLEHDGWADVAVLSPDGRRWDVEGENPQGVIEYRMRYEPHRCLDGRAQQLALAQLEVLEALMREVGR